jgi:hypothetical protein
MRGYFLGEKGLIMFETERNIFKNAKTNSTRSGQSSMKFSVANRSYMYAKTHVDVEMPAESQPSNRLASSLVRAANSS